ncbi:hypothetical protein ASD62_14095 [Phycicoccus sp. Root563]|uniref:hypothetical protein n=1 Tax=unclassified Phycicoccus TaxID=2637926 RepID=UPI0007024C62|nr:MULTISPECIES: hypothetical protein [unclassified Phycicoccus]KQU67575.1 hypothetical protein ASC58_13635 [Phycicoccus sp. Root101]KQZ90253.1 hypothetical protein ASD62_14095 [Phycicoccus sp. Root563]
MMTMFWTVAFWILLPFLIMLGVLIVISAIVRRRRYQPTEDDWQDWSAKAARQRQGEHFDPTHGAL